MALVMLNDPNLSGSVDFEVAKVDLQDTLHTIMVDRVGTWQDLPGTEGAVLLSEPYARVYDGLTLAEVQAWEEYTDAPYPDWAVSVEDGALKVERA